MFDSEFYPHRARRVLPCLLIMAILCTFGCSKDDVKKMAASVQNNAAALATATKEKATSIAAQTKAKVEEQLPASGEMKLQLNPPLEIASANVSVVSIGDGRKNVVQIANYDVAGKPTSYPSILIQGPTSAADPASLAGQTVDCELFVRENGTAPIAMTEAGSPIKVNFSSFDPQNKTVSASITAGKLIRSDDNPLTLGGGSIIALVSGGGS